MAAVVMARCRFVGDWQWQSWRASYAKERVGQALIGSQPGLLGLEPEQEIPIWKLRYFSPESSDW
jgi:hypothetical protein